MCKPHVLEKIKQIFGQQAITSEGKPNFSYMGEQAFTRPTLLEQLNQLVHPLVGADFKVWAQSRKEPLLLKEAAIIFETGTHLLLDGVIVVSAPEELRIIRVMQRNGFSREQVKARMERQWPEEQLLSKADFIVHNDESQLVIPQILSIISTINSK
jgi:dephospho-CoA kinase